VWAWRKERIHSIASSAHRLLTLFPFEAPLYSEAPLAVTFVGHPLASDAAGPDSRREARALLQLYGEGPIFALLPGSRMSELVMHSEPLLKAAATILRSHPEARFLVPLVSRETREHFERSQYRLRLEALPLILLYGHAGDALRAADVALVASGTATLEAALARCPHIVFYRVNALTARLVLRKLLLPYVSLPNVVAGRFIVAEFLQREASGDNLARAAINLYEDTVTRERLELIFAGMAGSLRAESAALAAEAVTDELRAAGVTC
jgi:lipid-A-disaccharide synthase